MVLARIRQIEAKKSFIMFAYCILPDHIHLLMQLPEEESNFSYQIRELKRLVTLDLKKELCQHSLKIWQNRFWEHTIRDEKDLERHLNYIHFNPVKHGYVEDAIDWKWSSYSEMVSSSILPLERDLDAVDELTKNIFGE